MSVRSLTAVVQEGGTHAAPTRGLDQLVGPGRRDRMGIDELYATLETPSEGSFDAPIGL